MRVLKLIYLALVQLFKQAGSLPQLFTREGRAKSLENDLEAERLDRIRNPSKYLGRVNLP